MPSLLVSALIVFRASYKLRVALDLELLIDFVELLMEFVELTAVEELVAVVVSESY